MDFTDAFTNAVEAKQVAQQNKLKAETEAEQKVIEAEAAAKAASKREEELNIKAQVIVDALNDYVAVINPELAAALMEDDGAYDVADIRNIIDTALSAAQLSLSIAKKFAEPAKTPSKPDSKVNADADAIISNFLKNFID
jgi:regulator of protease activity HflC (stomatin/prohibitin superfamily)